MQNSMNSVARLALQRAIVMRWDITVLGGNSSLRKTPRYDYYDRDDNNILQVATVDLVRCSIDIGLRRLTRWRVQRPPYTKTLHTHCSWL